MRASWEAFVQSYSICLRLICTDCPYLPHIRNLRGEMEGILCHLNVDPVQVEEPEENRGTANEPDPTTIPNKKKKKQKSSTKLRKIFRDREQSQRCLLVPAVPCRE